MTTLPVIENTLVGEEGKPVRPYCLLDTDNRSLCGDFSRGGERYIFHETEFLPEGYVWHLCPNCLPVQLGRI